MNSILIIDDNEDDNLETYICLKNLNVFNTISFAHDLVEAFEHLFMNNNQYNKVLINPGIKSFDAYEFLRVYKSSELYESEEPQKIYFIENIPENIALDKVFDCGISGIIIKPLKEEILFEVLNV